MFVKPGSPSTWFFRFFEAQPPYCSLIPERNPRDISRGALSLNAKNHDHSLDFKRSTSAFSADGGISVTQEIVICDDAPLPGNREVQCLLLLGASLCCPWLRSDTEPAPGRCLSSEGSPGQSHLTLVPRTHRQTLGLLPCAHSPPFSLRLVCELALCPVHYAQVWLLATTFLTPTLGFVGIPSATWGTLAFPVTCTNDSLHFAPSLDGFHGVSGFTEPADLHREATPSSFSWHHSTCTINTAFINYGRWGRSTRLARIEGFQLLKWRLWWCWAFKHISTRPASRESVTLMPSPGHGNSHPRNYF